MICIPHPMLAPVFYAFQQTREDLAKHTAGLSAGQVWARPHGLAPLGFHLRHIAGSVDRLTAYLEERPLDTAQMAALAREMQVRVLSCTPKLGGPCGRLFLFWTILYR